MKIVLDTTIFVSALISPRGIPAQILQHQQPFHMVASEETLAELQRVLGYKRIRKRYKLDDAKITKYLELIRADCEMVELAPDVQGVSEDPDDDKFLACAVAAQADCIVSGDPHLHTLGEFRDIVILTPRQFLDFLDQL